MDIEEMLEERYPAGLSPIKADGFDDCIIGVTTNRNSLDVLCYSSQKIVTKLMTRDGMNYDEAVEFFEYNIQGAYVGPRTPIYIHELSEEGPLTVAKAPSATTDKGLGAYQGQDVANGAWGYDYYEKNRVNK